MRIIAGRCRGRRLATPKWPGLRPTSDKLRETLFNILGPRIAGARVLDGFAGTGALGIEALSRGASHATFVDRDRRALTLIGENLRRCGISNGYAMMRGGIETMPDRSQAPPFDVILLDPPYDQDDLGPVVARMGDMLAPDGMVVLEHARRRSAPAAAGVLVCTRRVQSGDSALSFYEREDRPARGDGSVKV